MRNLLIVIFICIVGYGLLSQPHKEKADETIETALEQVPEIIEAIEDKLEEVYIQHEFPKGTTREDLHGGDGGRVLPKSKSIHTPESHERYWQLVKEYDDWYYNKYLPNTVLPSGETLQQRLDSGNYPGK